MGGGTGIGAATAHLLAMRGAHVVVAGLGERDLAKVVTQIEAGGGRAVATLADVTREDDIVELVSGTMGAFGRIDGVHGNAAATGAADLARDAEIAALDIEAWDRTMAVNLRGCALLAKHTIPPMIKGGGGVLVFSGSGRGSQGYLEYPAYGASKAGLQNLSRYIATQYGKQGIRSNTVEIGLIMTDAVAANVPNELRSLFLAHHLTRELGTPDDIAQVVAFLLSDESRFVTGTTIAVDGGLHCHTSVYADQMRMMQAEMNKS
jgi:NAD(P)-dependent dehydrogenase (short-subunit alcohol dehydrogenase family)